MYNLYPEEDRGKRDLWFRLQAVGTLLHREVKKYKRVEGFDSAEEGKGTFQFITQRTAQVQQSNEIELNER